MKQLETEHTSNALKLLRHTEALNKFRAGRASPPQLVIAPTSRCQLRCAECCYRDRAKQGDMNLDKFAVALDAFMALGSESAEVVGGGDPTLHPEINRLFEELFRRGFQVGLSTNGVDLSPIDRALRDSLAWVRLAGGTIEQGRTWDYANMPQRAECGVCLIWHAGTTPDAMRTIVAECRKHDYYLRIVPNTIGSQADVAGRAARAEAALADVGGYDRAFVTRPNRRPVASCWAGFWKPFLWYDNYVYACPSSCLSWGDGANNDRSYTLSKDVRLCRFEDAREWYAQPVAPHAFTPCRLCRFANLNEMVDAVQTRGIHDKFA